MGKGPARMARRVHQGCASIVCKKKNLQTWIWFVSLCLQLLMHRIQTVWARFCMIPYAFHASTQYAFSLDSKTIHLYFLHRTKWPLAPWRIIVCTSRSNISRHSDGGLSLFPEICSINGLLTDSAHLVLHVLFTPGFQLTFGDSIFSVTVCDFVFVLCAWNQKNFCSLFTHRSYVFEAENVFKPNLSCHGMPTITID